MRSKPIIFFDGSCLVCNRWVQFVLDRDEGRFLFAPLQGETAKKFLPQSDRDDLNSLVLVQNDSVQRSSTAVLSIVASLGGIYKLSLIFFLCPRFIRDFVYKCFAKSRYKVMISESCRVLSAEEKKRFLP